MAPLADAAASVWNCAPVRHVMGRLQLAGGASGKGEIISRAAAASRGRFERALQGPEDRGFTDLIVGRQSCHGLAGSVPLGDFALLADIKGRRAPELLALRAGLEDSGLGAGEDQRALELADGAKDRNQQLAGRRGGVAPRLSQAGEAAAGFLQVVNYILQVAAGSRQPVQAGHYNDIAGVKGTHQLLELRPAVDGLARPLFTEDALAP